MEITGYIAVSEKELVEKRFNNSSDDGVSLLMKDSDEPLNMDEDGNMYIEDNPKILGVFISRHNIPLLQKVLELIDEYEPQFEFSMDGIQAAFIPDKDYIDMVTTHPCYQHLPLIDNNIDKEDI